MSPAEAIAAQLESLWAGQTLATLRDDAARQLNGTSFQALRPSPGPRRVLIVCFTGEHEIRKLGPIDATRAQSFGDWAAVSLFEAVARTFIAGGFAYDFDPISSKRKGVSSNNRQ